MWKIFLVGTVWISLVCGQCDNYVPCYGQATSPTIAHQQNTGAARQSQEFINNSSTVVTPQWYYPAAPMATVHNITAGRPTTVLTSSNTTTVAPQLFNPSVPVQSGQNVTAGRPTTVLTSNTTTMTQPSYHPSAPVPTVPNTNVSSHSQTSRPPSPVIFPDHFDNTEIPSESFSAKLFELMSEATTNRNLLFSPMSLETILSFIYTISEGKLFQELANLLDLPQNRSHVAQKFQALIKSPYNSNVNNTLIVANKLYYEKRFGIVHQNVRNLAENYFASGVEPIDFSTALQASDLINSWIADKTRHLIKDIITSDSLSPDTRAVLINSLYFKSEWQEKFSTYDTEKQPFFLSQQRQVLVDMMYIEDVFRYGEFEELKAAVLELPYKLDDFRMMIILPNEIDDLSNVERRLATVSLKSISERLHNTEVTVRLPQFKIEFEMDLVQPLRKLGLFSLFTDEAQIKLFKNQHKPLNVDQIKQKTFISVNEAGTEAAAVTFAKFVPLSVPLRNKRFSADHPFIFVIRNSKASYFMGHVAQFSDQN